ncbi:ankyrin repeat-containing domain protein [Aspergillus spectabilis]
MYHHDTLKSPPKLPPELLYSILDSLSSCWTWESFTDTDEGLVLVAPGLRWYLNLRLVNCSFNSIIFHQFLARVLAPREDEDEMYWHRRRSVPPTDGAMAMGRQILRTVLDARACVTSKAPALQVADAHSYKYALANILVEGIDEMVSFFSETYWHRRRSVPPTDGAMGMGRRILRTVLDARACVASKAPAFQVADTHSYNYSLANALVKPINKMVSFFSATGTTSTTAASIVDEGKTSASASAVTGAAQSEGEGEVVVVVDELDEPNILREIYLNATASILAAYGADRIIELLADWGPFQTRNRERETPTAGSRTWLPLALMITAYLGRVSELKALLQLPRADLALDAASRVQEVPRQDYLFPPLMSAGLGGYFNTVKVLMRAGVSLKSRTRPRGGITLPWGILDFRYCTGTENILHFAALGGHVKLVRFVLRESGNAAQARDSRGHTALVWALVSGQTAVARELLEWRAGDPTERKKEMMKNLKKEKREKKRKKKQQRNAEAPSLSTPDEDEDNEPQETTAEAEAQTLFRYALRSQKIDPVIDAFPGILEQEETLIAVAEWGTPEQLRHLLSMPKTPMNCRSAAAGATVLHHAIYSGNREKIEIVLGQPGVDVNTHAAPGVDEETPLHAACRQTPEIVKLLLARHDLDLLSLDSEGRTPLMIAVSSGRHDIFNLLLERSGAAEIWRKDFGGETILSLAAFSEDEKLLRRLLDLAPAMDIVHDAISVIDEYLAEPKRLRGGLVLYISGEE